jgi:tetratricopeptide (TPR) repeat protein
LHANLQANAEAEVLLREGLELAREIGDKATEALSARVLSMSLCSLERYAEAADLAEASRVLAEQIGDRQDVARGLSCLGYVAKCQGDWDRAARYYGDALAIPEANRLHVAVVLLNLGDLAFARGTFEEARGYLERGRAIAQECGDRATTTFALFMLGTIAAREGRITEACSFFEQARDINEETGNRASAACDQARLGYVLVRQGRLDAGWIQLVRALLFSQTGDYPEQTKEAICCIGQASVHAGRLQRGAELLGLTFRLAPQWSYLEMWLEPELDILRAALGAEGLEAALARGAALGLDQVVAEILACETPEAYWGAGAEGVPPASDGL